MVLEATMIVVDNSETSRNGDYLYVHLFTPYQPF